MKKPHKDRRYSPEQIRDMRNKFFRSLANICDIAKAYNCSVDFVRKVARGDCYPDVV